MTIRILTGDVMEQLATLEPESVHCVVTSPPYWGLRDYKLPPQVWGGDAACEHHWGRLLPPKPGRGNKPGDLSTSSLTNPERQDSMERPTDAGATALVADRLGRNAILIELNPDYVEIARKRLRADSPLLAEIV